MRHSFPIFPALLCSALLASLPGNVATASDPFPDGLTPQEITAALGPPTSVLDSQSLGDAAAWRYETPNGLVTITFVNGRATLKIPLAGPSVVFPAPDADAAFREAQKAHAENRDEVALVYLRQCLAFNARYRRCITLQRDILPEYEKLLASRYESTQDIMERHDVIERALELRPDSATLKNRLESVNAAITARLRHALLGLSDARKAIDAARIAQTSPAVSAAAQQLSTFPTYRPAVDALANLRAASVLELEKAIEVADSFDKLNKVTEEARYLDRLVGPGMNQLSAAVRRAAIRLVVNLKLKPADAAQSRALEELLRSRLIEGRDESKGWPWSDVGAPDSVIQIYRSANSSTSCSENGLTFFRLPVITPNPPRIVDSDEADIHVEIALECAVETHDGASSGLNSTYIASYQQVVNDDYVRARADLERAQGSLAQIRYDNSQHPPANAWIAAAQGLAEGFAQSAVNKAFAILQETPPYLSQPVKLPYVAERHTVTRTSRVAATVSITDAVSTFKGAAYAAEAVESTDYSVGNVLAGDAEGLQNRAASLQSEQVLLEQAYEKLRPAIEATTREALAPLFAERAHQFSKDPLRLAGNLLFARDLSPSFASSLNPNGTLDKFRAAPLNGLSRLNLDSSELMFPALRAVANPLRTNAPVAPSHVGVQRALAAVVTITTSSSLGSGFFVDKSGFVVTNSHVVNGVAKAVIHTSDGSSYLATVVKTSASPDLALLKVIGPVTDALSLGDSDSVEVGTDVFAIGSARGLEGTVTKGIISAVRNIDGVRYFQIDAAINPGNSGGPLLNAAGEVIGINTFKLMRDGSEALGFAIVTSEARRLFGDSLK